MAKDSVTTVTRCFTFDAGHRVFGHEGKCSVLHGHTYKAEVTVEADTLDVLGRVIDFSVIKEKVGGWLDATLDHVTILNQLDPLINVLIGNGQKVFVMLGNPTAERLAQLVFEQTNRLLEPNGIRCVGVRMHETGNCYADYKEAL